jgi:acyl-CoA thioesterase-2
MWFSRLWECRATKTSVIEGNLLQVDEIKPVNDLRADEELMASLLGALDITDTHARTSEDIFTGRNEWMPTGRLFGGQVLAQSLLAALHTVDGDRRVHSLHGYFLRAGYVEKPVTLAVDRIHDGRSFSTRRAQAHQDGQPIFSMIASFQTEDVGLEHQVEMPSGLIQPEDLPSYADVIEALPEHPITAWNRPRVIDSRHVEGNIVLSVDGEQVAHQGLWFKTVGALPADPLLHTATLAYASDFTIMESVFRRHGLPMSEPGLRLASLDHAMWFHNWAPVDDWLFYAQESPVAKGGRGLSFGRIFTRDGLLVASVAQEGMVRVPEFRNAVRKH